MQMHHEESQRAAGERLDRETLARVTALAARLQAEAENRVSLSEMEAVGAELGIRPEMMHRALAEIRSQQSTMPVGHDASPTTGIWELGRLPLLCAAITWFMMRMNEPGGSGVLLLFGAPAGAAVLNGYLAGRRPTALSAGAAVWIAEWLVMAARYGLPPEQPWTPFVVLGVGAAVTAGLGNLGCYLRTHKRKASKPAIAPAIQ